MGTMLLEYYSKVSCILVVTRITNLRTRQGSSHKVQQFENWAHASTYTLSDSIDQGDSMILSGHRVYHLRIVRDPCAWRFLDAQAVNLLDLLSSRGYRYNPA
jgi:hypothetical protein